ncbi:hypothetical protein [Erythrobacter sp.]|uniref:hypothetical protein n=1 Tax=Erythrobacter sp. TaxID=1042 RepID=UPI001425FEF9|nr:hypothetical protein [Erythrobacter sp.]QIQ85985.1 MAG: hypothetical protein G9473_04285 [Erythrobacter sp.]
MGEKADTNSGMGIAFFTIGAGMTITFGLLFGPAFIGIGLPFMVLGFVFMGKKGEGEE